jgi:shikimate 5-dehydrogenase
MAPGIDNMPLATTLLEPAMVVMDMVYNPLKTRFLLEAEKIGCTVVDGLSMFVHQGAVQFELWTSQKAPVDIMRKVVFEELQGYR